MKKTTITFIILFAAIGVFAQDNALSKFEKLCTVCNDETADKLGLGCRTLTGVCDGLTADKEVFIQKKDKKVKRIVFAYTNDGTLEYGVKAGVTLVNKKGKTIYSSNEGDMLIMNKEGKIVRSVSTQITDPSLLKLDKGETVLFVFLMDLAYKKRDKLRVKVNISKLDLSTRKQKIFKEMKFKI